MEPVFAGVFYYLLDRSLCWPYIFCCVAAAVLNPRACRVNIFGVNITQMNGGKRVAPTSRRLEGYKWAAIYDFIGISNTALSRSAEEIDVAGRGSWSGDKLFPRVPRNIDVSPQALVFLKSPFPDDFSQQAIFGNFIFFLGQMTSD